MKPPPFEYFAPETLLEALALLAEHGPDAKPLAGGQSLVPAMNFRLAAPSVLVDLNGVGELAGIRETDDGIEIGAMTRQRAVERSGLVARRAPLLAEAMPWIAHPQIRNRGTLGGTLAHADPAAELPAVARALGARLRLVRAADPAGRTVDADDFFTGLFATALEPDELVAAVEVPVAGPRAGHAFLELARRHGDYALVGVAVAVGLDDAGRCAGARIALLSVGDGPVRAASAEALLAGEEPTPAVIEAAAAEAAARDVDPPGDIHATAEYRRHLVRVLSRRALGTAFDRARETAA